MRNMFFKTTGKELAKERADGFRDYWRYHGFICYGAGKPQTKSSRWRAATPDEIASGMFIDGIPMMVDGADVADDITTEPPAPEPPSLYHENDTTETVD